MSILDILKKIKFPNFGDDFIQDPAEKEIAEASAFGGTKVVFDPLKDPEKLAVRKNLHEWVDDEWERHGDPSDGASMSNMDIWEE
ncbi:MAG: hypothetical protein IH613_00590 [Desulfuromonadales bacterium]|nr:hypothetical protein [Desulfuromonadales bacterium]